MPTTYTPLATTTLNSNQSSVTFSGISGAYTDLVLVVNAYQNSNSPVYLRVNGLNTSIYSNTWIRGDGTTATTGRYNTAALGGSGLNLDNFSALPPFPSNFSGQATYHIMNYSNTTTNKTVLLRHGSSNWTIANVGLIQTTSAITSLEIYPFATTWASGSTFSLYGIASAAVVSGAKATGGDVVATDGTYWYHAFRSSGTFTPTQALTADVLVVAGGGGSGSSTGGNYVSGGGGAGGYLKHTSQSLTATNYTVTVGAGGTGTTTATLNGNKGSDSQFASLTASVGGGFGGANTGGANSGGSGGGASVGATGGAATSGQGFAGGNGGPGANNYTGGGGGGAGAVGAAGTSNNGGNGGAGTNADSSWLSATGLGVSGFIAGGGGGASWGAGLTGAGGSGGGGLGGGNSTQGAGTAGTVNTGSGAGGGGNGYNGANGGSGLVIVRYAV